MAQYDGCKQGYTWREHGTGQLLVTQQLGLVSGFLSGCRFFQDARQAVVLAEKADRLKPDNAGIQSTLGIARYRTGDWQRALTALERSVALTDGGNCVDWLFLAMTSWRLGDHAQAHHWYSRAASHLNHVDSRFVGQKDLTWLEEARTLLGLEKQPKRTSLTAA